MTDAMGDQSGADSVRTSDLEMLATRARTLEASGFLEEALAAWRAALRIDRNYLPAWEASARILRKLRGAAREPNTR